MMPLPLSGLRRRVLCVVIAACALFGTLTPPARSLENSIELSFRTLPNGMRVVVAEDHSVPVVQTAIWYRFGASEEVPGKTGLAHALAHMMFRGTPYLSASGLDDTVTHVGADETATTANDYTVFRFMLPADKLELALRIEADRMQHLLLDDGAWADEKTHVLAEYDSDLRQPLTRLYAQVCKTASPAPVCALSALGDRQDIAAATAQDLRAYYQSYYAPNEATLVVTGDARPNDVFALATAAFGSIPRSDPPPPPAHSALTAYDAHVSQAGDFPYEVVDLAFAAPGTLDPDGGALQIIDSVINNKRSDFYKALVRSGYTITYSTQLDQNAHAGLYHIFLVTAPEHSSAQARDAFADVMRTAQDHGFPADLVRAAKVAIARRATYARDSIAGLGERVGYAAAVEGIDNPALDDERIAALSDTEVTAAARRYFGTPAVTGLLQPGKTKGGEMPRPPVASVTDDFSDRAPAGKVIEARWVRQALLQPITLQTRVRPTAFFLRNGMRVLVQPVRTNPTVFVRGTVDSSPAFDQPGKEGTGAMLSTLLASGSRKYSADAGRALADELGATLDLGTDFDAHSRTQDWPKLIDVIADSLENPSLAPADVDFVRRQTLTAVGERDTDPDYRANADFERLLLRPDDPTLREATQDSIRDIAPNDLRSYANRFLRPDLTTITVVGDVAPNQVRAVLESAFAGWRCAGPKPNIDPGPIPPVTPAARYVVTDQRYIEAQLGMRAVARPSPDYPELDVIDELLGPDGGFDTRLMDQLRTKRDLVYGASSSLESDRFRGTFDIRLTAEPKKMNEAVEVVREQLARLQDDPVGPFELDRAKTKIVARGLVAEESTETIAARVHGIGVDHMPLDYEVQLPDRFSRIDGADILRTAQKYLTPHSMIEVYEGPRP
jgi:zinc protease